MAQHVVSIHTNAVSVQSDGYMNDRSAVIIVENPYDLILKVDDKEFRFDIKKDGSLGLHLMNGIDCKIAKAPAYTYPSPYIVLG